MSDKIAYKPINAEEAADVEEADTTNRSAPRWTLPNSQHWSRGWMRISFEVVLVVVIFLLSLKIMLDDRTSTNSGCKGPNDPKKDCTFTILTEPHAAAWSFDELTRHSWFHRHCLHERVQVFKRMDLHERDNAR